MRMRHNRDLSRFEPPSTCYYHPTSTDGSGYESNDEAGFNPPPKPSRMWLLVALILLIPSVIALIVFGRVVSLYW